MPGLFFAAGNSGKNSENRDRNPLFQTVAARPGCNVCEVRDMLNGPQSTSCICPLFLLLPTLR